MNERAVRGKNFVFVGGSQGMGRAAALALAERGASILIVGRSFGAGAAAVAEARARGASSAEFLSADISGIAGIRQAADGIQAWKPELHGVMHTALAPFKKKIVTPDALEFSFALQYFARAALNRLLIKPLAASGDGRVVHVGGNVSPGMARVDLNDLQFETRKWSYFKALLGTHHLGYLHLQEATRRYADLPVSFSASCVESVKTQMMQHPDTPFIMRLLGKFGTTPELAARNAVTLLTSMDRAAINGAIVPHSKRYQPQPIGRDAADAAKLWDITSKLAQERGLILA